MKETLTRYALVFCTGFMLRSVLLCIPALLPLLSSDLGLSYTEAGLLISLPVLVIALSSWWLGSIVDSIGSRFAVTLGLVAVACGSLLRAGGWNTWELYGATILMSLGITLVQCAMPQVIGCWKTANPVRLASLFASGFIVGEFTTAGATLPLLGIFFGGTGWKSVLLLWSLPVAAMLLCWIAFAGRDEKQDERQANNTRFPVSPWLLLCVGTMLGCGSLIYFGTNGWLAVYNQAQGASALTPLSFFLLNVAQLPVCIFAAVCSRMLAGKRAPFFWCGAVCIAAFCCWFFFPIGLEDIWLIVLGAGSALCFTLGMSLPLVLVKEKEVARFAGSINTVGYLFAFIGPFVGGWLLDVFRIPIVALLPVGGASLLLAVLALLIPINSENTRKNH